MSLETCVILRRVQDQDVFQRQQRGGAGTTDDVFCVYVSRYFPLIRTCFLRCLLDTQVPPVCRNPLVKQEQFIVYKSTEDTLTHEV